MNKLSEALADDIRARLNGKDFKLPSLPDTVLKVQKLMAGEDYDVADIADILSRDSAFATVVLRMANSARFNPSGKEIRNMTMAIQRIGTKSILQLLVGVASRLFSDVRQPELRKLLNHYQEHSLLVAVAAEQLAHISQTANPADTFMAGLLHDQGVDVLLIAIPDVLQQASEAERSDIILMFHREMGARLLHKWQLPEEFVLAAQHHGIESGDRPRSAILDCIDTAEAIDNMMQEEKEIDDAAIAGMPAARRLKLNEAQIAGIITDVEDNIDELRQAFAA